jgi:hypothetical protein
VIIVRAHEFRAVIAFDPSAHEHAVRRFRQAGQTECVVEPRGGQCLPAVISLWWSPPPMSAGHIIVRVHLLTGEAEAYFAAGHPFDVWADAIVDDRAIRGERILGHGVIVSKKSARDSTASNHRTHRAAVAQPLPYAARSRGRALRLRQQA